MESQHINTNHKTGRILHLQRLSTEDGPGIRTTVFFKGCPLSCEWCHNPESISSKPQLQWHENRCIGCASCIQSCPQNALQLTSTGNQIDRNLCNGCGLCAEICPANALELLGTDRNLESLTKELLKDKTYYEQSGGGVTASGGEPTLQSAFVTKLFQQLQQAGIHTALDTCGLCQESTIKEILPFTNLILFDLKFLDNDKHITYTGQSNQQILQNLQTIADLIRQTYPETRLWIRTPLIPGATATAENIQHIARFIDSHLPDIVDRWELCAFNNLCQDKYQRLDMVWKYDHIPLLEQNQINQLEIWAKNALSNPQIAIATGAAKA